MLKESGPLVSAAEAARLLNVDVSTIGRLATAGDLPTAVKAPGRRGARMFELTAVEDLRARRSQDRVVS